MINEKLQNIIKSRDSLDFNGKKKLLKILKECKKSYKSLIYENDDVDLNVIAKKFNTQSDFNSYVAQHRGLQILPQEKQAIVNYTSAKPVEMTDFMVKYESTDDYSNNNTTIVKKLKEGNQFCWTAFSKNTNMESSTNTQQGDNNLQEIDGEQQPSTQQQANQQQPPPEETPKIDNTLEVIKSVPFTDETNGAKIVSEFLIKLDI
jgi:hypothetical protein